ncbi:MULTISPECIES: tRNA (adenosine(37)-N6)-dimethylallyltransferase MiaA [unclassified Polaribacter]|uniref:tRNA (adenosine(37)-N6)-dimethylallyltransferase MiaA n=1 Tax=unclassified Polaribacter TaxID=196858 RepID=UPI0011BFA92E|nr:MULTISPECIES: tRNA (adenosine(37)-N6)-dimethylallyltransferase MiaA [unclassified Polaribacter]TXD51181.1 tRNA (adenosine(37)-N6)-dimethylallyltransferase MiaA [Polaribacter sp. IC063]TXD59086.1 tRNA (adenosine(37)-N6)-dimethylallyltransferase MiaA [Polaribacter sp. IC066]
MIKESNNTLITIVGPTAIGKTALSIQLANYFNADIVSSDSRQFYKEMTIGTAVPDADELAAATHHFIQNRSVFEDYNVGQFERDALAKLDVLFQKNKIQIMVGGSGLYIDAVLKGLDYFPEVDKQIREDVTKVLETEGIEVLQQQLKELDVETFNTIAIDNPHRLMRALEICIGSGIPYSTFKNKPKTPRNFKIIKIGLTADRENIYDRINQRVDRMMDAGLLEEAKNLYPHKNLNALQTVGYRELFSFFDGDFTQQFAVSEIKKNTRRFAKRQVTWFKRDEKTLWFDFKTSIHKIIEKIKDE